MAGLPGLLTWLAVVVAVAAAPVSSAGATGDRADFSHLLEDEPEFLKVDEAFVLSVEVASEGKLVAEWRMPDGYYLYRHRFAFEVRPAGAAELGTPEIPAGKKKVDEFFGDVEVYYHEVRVEVPLGTGVAERGAFEVGVSYQGCADRGLCYPPETKWFAIEAGAIAPAYPATTGPAVGNGPEIDASRAPMVTSVTEEQRLAGLLDDGSRLVALLVFFAAGLGLAFTPCVLPMVPILSSIIVGQGAGVTRARAFTLSLAYVLGMAVTYALLGVVVGTFGASMNLQAALQSPPVLVGFSVVFVALALAMFGFWELRLPQVLQERLDAASNRQTGGKHVGVAIMGALSALVVSPCVSAPLAGALIYLSSTGDAALGGFALLALALGMGTPLLVIGASGGHLLPRAGAWMEAVKAVFGVLLLAVAVWLLERVVPATVSLLLWSALAIGVGVYLGALDFSPRRGWGQLWKACGAFAFLYGVLLLIGAASGAHDPLAPLETLASRSGADARRDSGSSWRPVKGNAQLDLALEDARAVSRPAILDLYADWCISCKVMERDVFTAPEVEAQLGDFQLLRADVTRNDSDDQALLERFGLFGPPSLVFFDARGRELDVFKIHGEMDRGEFSAHLARVLSHLSGA